MATKKTETKAKLPDGKPGPARKGSGYDADAIQMLEGLDAVRKRPGMYIGGTGSGGLHHLVWELIDNAVDEAAAGLRQPHRGHAPPRQVGRGAPTTVAASPSTSSAKRKVSALEVVLTELHAGGKFGGGAYGASGGLHGVGASVVNALSTQARRRGRPRRRHPPALVPRPRRRSLRRQRQVQGRVHELRKVKQDRAEEDRHPRPLLARPRHLRRRATIDLEHVRDRVAHVCFLVPGLKVVLVDKRAGGTASPRSSCRAGGLADYVDYLSVGETVTEVITLTGSDTFDEKVPVDGKMATRRARVPRRRRAALGQGLRHHGRLSSSTPSRPSRAARTSPGSNGRSS